jgi:hypothetical protein
MHIKGGLIFIILLSFVWQGCYESIEGCTDPLADNYSFIADDKCKDCCTYPGLLITLEHKWGGEIFENNKQYINNLGRPFVVNSHKFYLSNIMIYDDLNQNITNQRLKIYTINSNEINTLQDFCLINGTLSDCRSGSFRYIGEITRLKFNINLPTTLNSVDSISVSRDQHLSWSEGMYRDGAYQGLFFNITSATNQTNYSIYINFNEIIELELNSFRHLSQGQVIEIPIEVNYEELFKNIDFLSEEEIRRGVIENIKDIFKQK